MQLDLQDNTWRHRSRSSCPKPVDGLPFYLETRPSTRKAPADQLCDTPTTTPEDRILRLLDYPSSNRTALNPTQQQMLALQTQPENSDPDVQMRSGVTVRSPETEDTCHFCSRHALEGTQQQGAAFQKLDAEEEIAPGDIKYRLEPLCVAQLKMQRPSNFGQYFKPQWVPFSTTYGESFKPWKTEPMTHCGEKSSYPGASSFPRHVPVVGTTNPGEYRKKQGSRPSLFKNPSGDYDMTTTHQISFQKPLLGQSVFSTHVQGRKVARIEHPGYVEYISQYQRDFQAPGKYIQHVQKETAPGWQPTTQLHQGLSRPKQMTVLGGNSTAKFDGDTVTRLSYLPKILVKRVKGKCPSSTLGGFKAKFQTENTSKKFFPDWGAQPQVCYGPHYTDYEKPLGEAV
nr:uncharacterized protein LOC105876092 isoform X2 [Microcebus murinus]